MASLALQADYGLAFAGVATIAYRVFETGNATAVTDWTTTGVTEVGGANASGSFYVDWTIPAGFTAGRYEFRDANPATVAILGGVIAAIEVQAALGTLTAAAASVASLATLILAPLPELTAPPVITAGWDDALAWILAWARNKRAQSNDGETLFRDDESTELAARTVSDDETTLTVGQWS